MRNLFKKLILMGVAVTLAGIAEAKTFRYATTGDVLGLDPHANNEGPTNTMKGKQRPRTGDVGDFARFAFHALEEGRV